MSEKFLDGLKPFMVTVKLTYVYALLIRSEKEAKENAIKWIKKLERNPEEYEVTIEPHPFSDEFVEEMEKSINKD